jgi:hypothetical protein
MAIKHKIRNSGGKLVEVELTPRKAIRSFCLECMCHQATEVPKCTAPICPLFPFRMGEAHTLSDEQRKLAVERGKRSGFFTQKSTISDGVILSPGIQGSRAERA